LSGAAEEAVKAFTHPEVKGSARALLEKLAAQIPEGQTMTAPIALEEFVAMTGYSDKSTRDARDVLVRAGVVRVVGGGQGRRASYELLLLSGAGMDPVLPLIGPAKPPRPSSQQKPSATPDLFSLPAREEIRANNIGNFYRSTMFNIGSLYRSWCVYFGSFYRSCVLNIGNFYRSSLPQGVASRARDVHTFKELHTHTPPTAEPIEHAKPPPCRWRGTVHEWCGRVCVPKGLHQEFLRKGHTPAWLLAFYERTCAAIPIDERITVDDYKFWRAALKAALEKTAAGTHTETPYTCPHTDPPCEQPNWRCRQRTALEAAKAEEDQRRRQFG
jgi:hypothetical protein